MVRGLLKNIASSSLSIAGNWQHHQLRRLNIHEYQLSLPFLFNVLNYKPFINLHVYGISIHILNYTPQP
ncbi:putative succinate--CoA ligase (ADP-forming) [Lupinus albus]|uniref:Putative succinate--CoA ligase (ADP-forming) n=1 Tax=Lupinus albus TaxID=3870 RepID=A0A6A4NM36_LUPAL|nr:putative succinate--CoA ligase (ADP-forming) [Lupinus albus]